MLSNKEKAVNAKLAPKYIGPLTAKRIISPVIVDLIDENNKWHKHIHVHDLKADNSDRTPPSARVTEEKLAIFMGILKIPEPVAHRQRIKSVTWRGDTAESTQHPANSSDRHQQQPNTATNGPDTTGVLSTLQQKLENLNKSNLIDCHPLVTAIQQGLDKRFCTTFEKKELIIATCLHPKFKLNWLSGEKKKLAEIYLGDLLGIQSTESSPKDIKSDEHDDFFIFEQHKSTQTESEEEELQRFLKSKNCNIDMLNDYPKLKKLFLKYNTALPSSASVERMFSVGGSVLTPQRGHLYDDTIEQQILLKINKEFR
ncbi:uncharacterized protein LOC116849605 [Odontomachus brunneus]|uniref:uncharacterized protein LOC116849605 n=1 Tax=Odontomachus brunneus TaxID=486640 RepID=UPI0013F1B916|nr:uncharacterized protein LOC116849605 [Odontomachus brunneus]